MSKNNKYKWDGKSALRKAFSDINVTVSTPTPIISVNKSVQVTKPHNPKTDAYRCCANCGKHYNFHKNGKCPGK